MIVAEIKLYIYGVNIKKKIVNMQMTTILWVHRLKLLKRK